MSELPPKSRGRKVVRARRERQIITYSEHHHTATALFQLGEQDPAGSYHQFLASITFTAFTLEAFLNHLGESQFKTWGALEKLPPKAKIEVLAEKLEMDIDFGQGPWQVVPEIFGIRNRIAHGKNEQLEDECMLSADSYDQRLGDMLGAKWQDYATHKNAGRALEQVENICSIFWAKAGLPEHELFRTGAQSGTATLVPGGV